ncbi:type IV pilus twitching motility protein PilT [Hyalangium versicolor]|uniref:type IV pilus twitching motility protein PilT n=1 Tax=Hyalangium versicolor TaxID=2861190 RepID=UPI001CCFB1DB|nr:PilT/PilU family type 4a pilus ATPase [Hyalangium versicolor]
MKPIAELLRYLSHPAITEIALTTGRCPMIKSVNGYEPVDSAVLTDEELNRTLLTMVGPARAAAVSEKPMKWSVRAEGVATLAVVAVRRGDGLSMRVMRTGDGAPKPAETPAPAEAASEPVEQSPAEILDVSAPVNPDEVVPPPVAPLIPPVRRPSVTGLRVIKAGSPQPPAPPPAVPAVPAARPPQTLEPLVFTPAGSIQPPIAASLIPPPPPPPDPPALEVTPAVFGPPLGIQDLVRPDPPIPTPPPVNEQIFAPPPPIASELFATPPPVDAQIFAPPPPPPAITPPAIPKGLVPPPPPIPTPPVEALSEVSFDDTVPPPRSEISSIDITIQEEEEEEEEEEKPSPDHTPPVAYRPALPPRTRPDFWRDLPALMEEARRVGASDLHIVSGRPAMFRVAGELKPDGEPLPPKRVEQMVLSQVPARLRSALDQEGSCDFALQSEAYGRFRVNVCRQRTGLKASFRLLSKDLPSLEALGLPLDLALATRHSHGLIFITGPAGHGKSSTLAALVDILNRETKRHILTVEDPVEHLHPRKRALMSQREVGTNTRSYASALEGALREDADVIVVGELRDTDTVRLALNASETGCLVLATMNTPNAVKTLERLIAMFPTVEQTRVRLTLAAHLRLIVSQRLLPTTNGMGMVAATEVLPGSAKLGQLLRENELPQLPALQQRGRGLGAIRLDESLADLVRSGKTMLEIAKGLAENPEGLEALVDGTAPELPPEPGSNGRKRGNPVGSLMGRKSA